MLSTPAMCDAMVVTERYGKGSTEWQSFRTLYGLTLDNANESVKKVEVINSEGLEKSKLHYGAFSKSKPLCEDSSH